MPGDAAETALPKSGGELSQATGLPV